MGEFVFIIDTDSYAGNFERPLTAYCTGEIGDCGVGADEAKEFADECTTAQKRISDLIDQRPDEHGCYRPTAIYETPSYQSVAIFLRQRPTEKQLKFLMQRAYKYVGKPPRREWDSKFKILGFRLVEETLVKNELWSHKG
jgi:hypothetical protein